jgi:hypothetical protein
MQATQICTATPAKLAAAAFPALQQPKLEDVSLNWKDLPALTSCPQLFHIDLEWCALPATAPATNPLAPLASLKELHVVETNSSIAQGLTQLTNLRLDSRTETMPQLLTQCMNGMQQLQQLDLWGSNSYEQLPAAVIAQLFAASHSQPEGLGAGQRHHPASI